MRWKQALWLQAQLDFATSPSRRCKIALWPLREWLSRNRRILWQFIISPFCAGLQPDCQFCRFRKISHWNFWISQVALFDDHGNDGMDGRCSSSYPCSLTVRTIGKTTTLSEVAAAWAGVIRVANCSATAAKRYMSSPALGYAVEASASHSPLWEAWLPRTEPWRPLHRHRFLRYRCRSITCAFM